MQPTPPPVLLLPPDPVPASAEGIVAPPGWTVHPGFDLPAEPWDVRASRVLCVGTVDDDDAAQRAMAAITRGAGLAVRIALRGAAHHRFLDDLHRVGEPVPYAPPCAPAIGRLTHEQRHLLDALAGGVTVTAAAATLNVSRRTANRMLADARAELGVNSNAAAARRWVSARTEPDA
jgi:DNA-binding NarL/FixJ family response regulator